MATRRDRRAHYWLLVMLLFMPRLLTGYWIRLTGHSSSRCFGRVEIYYNSAWGTVCDDYWDLSDALVVCRQMNCGTALSAINSAGFGQGSGQIWLDDVSCSGRESSLTQCVHRVTHDCSHSEDAGVVCSEGLPMPIVSLSPLEVTWGQSATVTCSITGLSDVRFFLRYSNLNVQSSSLNPAIFNLSTVTFDNKGPYQCVYEKEFSGQTLNSAQSDSLHITVKFPKASISVSPAPEVMWGQTGVTVTCSISARISGGTFTLKHRNRDVQTSRTTTFSLPRVTFDSEGPYNCLYQRDFSGHVLTSPKSDSLTLKVSVDPPVPTLCVSSPAGEKCSSDTVHVTRGDSFVLHCSVPPDVPEGLFLLWFSGSNSSVSEPSVNHSAFFNFPESQNQHEGQYSCVYQVKGAGRTYTSDTAPINIIINLPLALLVAPSVVGVLLILGLVSLLLFLALKKRSRGHQPQSSVQAQMAEARNEYLEDSDEDEGDYVNVDVPKCETAKHVSNPPVRSNPYQAHVSFNAGREGAAGQVRFVKNSETCSLEENSEDEDDDYENVIEMNSEEQENIYENF